MLDLNTLYEGWNTFIPPNTVVLANKYSDKYFKEFYKKNKKALYMYVLDQDSALKFFNHKDTLNIIKKSFLQKQKINVTTLKETDTLKYIEYK